MFKNVEELVRQAQSEHKKIYEVMIEQEMELSSESREKIIETMNRRYDIMEDAIRKGLQGVESTSGMTGYDAQKMQQYILSGKYLTDETILNAMAYAIATNEVNASMGIICATPTAGSAGVLPAVLFSAKKRLNASREDIVNAMFTAGAFGYIIANNAFISGAAGGCQAEIGSASAMAAAALTELAGGTPEQCAQAMAIALKNLLGLTCDPVAGLVEVPCIKRNAMGASNAIISAEMALAGIQSRISCDEVILTMYRIGCAIPRELRETALGGLAVTQTGKMWKNKILNETNGCCDAACCSMK